MKSTERNLLVVSAESQVVKTQISTSVKKVPSPQRQATLVSLHLLFLKLFSKQVAAQVGRPVKLWERTEVVATARVARMMEYCILNVCLEGLVCGLWFVDLSLVLELL